MKEYKDIFIRIFQIVIPIIITIIIPLLARGSFKRKLKKAKENLLELRKYIPGDINKTDNGLPYFKGRYGHHNIDISFERKKNTPQADIQITMGLSSGFPVKIYNRRIMPLKESIKTGVAHIDNLYSVISSSSEQAKSLILSISRDDISALNDFLREGIVIDTEKIILLKRNVNSKDTEPQKLLSVLEVTYRIARVVERLAPLKTSFS